MLIACATGVPGYAASPDVTKVPCKLTRDDTAVYVTILKFSLVWKPQVDPDSVHAYTLTAKDGNWSTPSGLLGASAETILSQAGDETRADFASKSTKSCYIGGFRKRDIDTEAAASPGGSDGKGRTSELGYWSGTINLSRIGFSSAKDEALVYAESSCGSSRCLEEARVFGSESSSTVHRWTFPH